MNHTKKCFSRVAAKRKGPRRTLALAVGIAQFFMLSGAAMPVIATPTGGRVVQGEGFITQGQNVTNVHQNTDLMTVQWDSFDLNQQEIVNFLQPGSNAWVLNHILQNGPSHIDGRINANGNVLLINPRGMIFGDNALINAGSFTASSLWLDKDDFLNGDFYFKDIDSTHGRIVNHGVIAAATGGFINLIGESVSNEGLLSANMGYVSVAAGSEVFLSFDDNNFLGVKVNKEVVNNDPGLQAAIENKGKIEAGTGKVMMNAQSARDLFSQAVNHSGVIEANGFGGTAVEIQANGAVKIDGDISSSASEQAGRISVNAESIHLAGQLKANGDRGGEVHLQAEHIGLEATATIDVSGRLGGGQALIGGAYQGADPNFRNAQTLYMADGATIYANAIENGDGGEVILWSDLHTHFYGNVFARGGRLAGNGGLVETSGKKYLSLGGNVNTLAPNGRSGTWLLDPVDITISDSGSGPNNITVAQLQTGLESGSVEISTSGTNSGGIVIPDAGTGAGDITISSAIDFSGVATTSGNSLTLLADNNIIIGASVSLLGDLILDAQNAVQINQSITTTGNLSLTMASYNLDPSAVLSVISGLAFNYRSGDQSLDLTTLATELTNVTAGTYTFDLGTGGTDVLIGTTGDDSFTANGANSVQASVGGKSVRFDGLEQLDGSTGNNSINLASSGATIGTTDFSSQGVAVSNVFQTSNTGTLTGTTGADSFSASANNEISIQISGTNTQFGGVTQVVGNGGADSVDVANSNAEVTGTGYNSRGMAFTAVNAITNTGSLSGSTSDDAFSATADNQISIQIAGNNTQFSNVNSVSGNGGNDSVDIANVDASLNASGFNSRNINFSAIDVVSNTDALTGNATADSFRATANKEITIEIAGSDVAFSGVNSVAGNGGADSVDIANEDASISATGFNSRNINFSAVNSVSNTDVLTGTASADSYRATADNQITVEVNSADIQFSQVASVVGNGGSDSVDIADEDATITATGFDSRSMSFAGVGSVSNTDVLTGSTSDDSFRATADNQITIEVAGSDIVFSNVNSVAGGGGSDSADIADQDAMITATGFNSRSMSFAGISSVSNTDVLTGTATDDSFRATASNQITIEVSGNDIQFANVNQLDGNGGTDSVDIANEDANLSATGFSSRSVAFSNVDTVTNTDQLLGTSAAEAFTIVANKAVSVNPGSGTIEFQGVNQLNGNTGSDSVNVNNNGVSLNSGSFSSHGIDFVQVATASNTGQITGQSGNDNFNSASSGNISVSGVNFSGVSAVDGNGGTDEVTLNSANANLNATGFNSNSIDFSDVDAALDTGELTATTDPEVFQINTDGSITVSGIRFAGVTLLDGGEAGDDSDEDRIVGDVNSFQISGNESATVTTSATSFTANNIELLESSNNTADLIGQSSVNDQFVIQASRQISAQGMRFSGLDQLTAQAEDTINAGNFGVTLSPGGFTSQNIAVSGASTVSNTGAITGSSSNESFNATSANSVSTVGIDFGNVTSVAGGGGSDSVDISNADAAITATGFDSRSISFSDIDTVNNTDVLTGSTSNDAFRTTADNEITIAIASSDVRFAGVNSVSGNGGNDSLDIANQDAAINATGFNSRSISFSGIDTVSNTDVLTGSASSDAFRATANNQITIEIAGSDIEFSNVNSVAGNGGSDSVDFANQNVAITATGYTGRSVNFTDVNTVTNVNVLTATSGDDSFSASADDQLTIQIAGNNTQFTTVGEVVGNGGTDSVDLMNGDATVTSTGFNGRNVNFSGFSSASNTDVLTGSASDDAFRATGSNEVTIEIAGSDIQFSGVNSTVGGGGNDSLDIANEDATISATGFMSRSINFSGINSVSNTDVLTGSTSADAFRATADNQITVEISGSDTEFSNVNSVTGNGGLDSVDFANQNVAITATGYTGRSVNFTDVNAVTNVNVLTATSGDDNFSATADDQLTIQIAGNNTQFTTVGEVVGNGGTDTVDLMNSDATVTATGFNGRNVNFNGFSSASNTDVLTGSASTDAFRATGSNEVTIEIAGSDIQFSGVNATAGGGGNDSLDIANQDATINATGFNSRSINFSDIDTVSNTDVLTGSTSTDAFRATADNQITVEISGSDTEFSNVNSVAGSGGSDSVDFANQNVAITATGYTGRSVNFTDVNTVTNVNVLTATSGDDNFSATADDQLTIQIAGNNTQFTTVGEVVGNGGTDTVDLMDGDATITATGFNGRNVNFSGFSSASNTDVLTGSASDDAFRATGSNEVIIEIAGSDIQFSGVNSTAGGGGNDSLDIANQNATINATGFNSRSINFSDIDTVNNTDLLTGSSSNDAFRATADNEITIELAGSDTQFLAVNTVDGNGGSDSVDINNENAVLRGTGFDSRNINFSDIDQVSNTDGLTGTTSVDSFRATAVNQITLQIAGSDTEFSGVNSIVGNGGSDTVDLGSGGAELTAGGFTGRAVTFSGVSDASNTGMLTGTTATDSFDATSANNIEVAGLSFSGVVSVDGAGGIDSVDLHDSNATLQSSGGFDGQSVNFTNVETANNTGNLTGSSSDDQFNLLGGRTISANWSGNGLPDAVRFNNVASLDAAGGTNDSVLATNASDTFNLVAGGPSGFLDNQLSYQISPTETILLANIEQVDAAGDFDSLGVFSTGIEINNGNNIVKGIELLNFEAFSDTGRLELVGASANDFFFIEGTGRVRSGNTGIIFTGVDSLVGDSSLANTVNLGGGGASLAGAQFLSQGITVSQINTIENTGSITGSSEAYSLVGNQQISVGNFNFSGVTSVNGGSSADLGNFAANLQNGGVLAGAVSFSGITVFSNISDLQGVADFTITDQQAINASGFQFSGLTQVQAQTGSLSGRGAQLLSNGQLNSAGIVFRGLQSVRDTGNLVGSDSDENFSLLPENTLSLAGISFTGVTGLDGAGGNDSINLNRLGVDLIDGGFTVGDFQILNIEQISETGELRGSNANENFAIQSDGRVSVSGFSFSDIDLISGGGGQDSLDLRQGGLALLDGVELSSAGIRINGVEDFLNIAALELTDQDDSLSVIDNNGFSLANYRFFGVQSIDGKAGNDQIQLAGQGLQLADGFALFKDIRIDNVESYAQVGNLQLNDLDNQIQVKTVQGFTVDGVDLSDVSFIDALGGTDRLDAAGADSLLLDNGNLQVSGTELRSVELIDNSNSLTGSALAEEFTLSDPGIVEVGSYRFTGLNSLNGGAGQDRLILVNRNSVTLDFANSSSGSVNYDGQSALSSFTDIDLIRLPNSGQLTLNGTATLQVQDFNLNGSLTLNDQIVVNAGGQSAIDGDLNVNDSSQFNTANNLQASGSLNTSGSSQVTVGGNVILGNGLNAGNSSVINIAADLSAQNEVDVQDDARLVLGGNLATDNNLNLNDNAQLQVTGRIDVNGDLSAQGQSNISTDSEINIVGQVNTSPTATINADSINLNVPEERVVTVQPEIDISAAVFSEIKVFINSNSSVRNASETSGLYSDDDLVDALIESADETAGTNTTGESAGSPGQE